MNIFSNISLQKLSLVIILTSLLISCGDSAPEHEHSAATEAHEAEAEKGPHHGRLLRSDNFTLELAIFETGVPPEFRAWATNNNRQLAPEAVDLEVTLTRLGGVLEQIEFTPAGDALRGDTVIYEPHSFMVSIKALHNGEMHSWQYDNFEGRTMIEAAVAEALEVKTQLAGAAVIQKTITVYGQLAANREQIRSLSARFEGTIKTVFPSLGERVNKGQKLAIIESNESLQNFTIKAPISGVITQRTANEGEQTNGRQLFTIVDTATVWAELSIFPADLAAVKIGATVNITDTTSGQTFSGEISQINVTAEADQSVKARVVLDNKNELLTPGRHISAKIVVGEHIADLAVKRTGLQSFRDFTVVYAQIGDQYEVRMLDLGVQAGEWAEVLGGLEPGTRYVSENSYVIKADIEKSGASHDH